MTEKPGSLVGGILLIGGSCVGAGMLALPILTGLAGFFPSLILCLCAWAFMTLTGLLLVEVNGWFDSRVNVISMAGYTLGSVGRVVSGTLYLFLFYSLLVAYISGSGSLTTSYAQILGKFSLPPWTGSLFFVLLFGGVVYQGTRTVDLWNRVLMGGKIATYLAMVFLGVQHIKPHLLLHTEPSFALFSLPVLVICFGYHNMIPTLTAYMKGDVKRVRTVIWGGSLLALAIYLIWELVVLGIVPQGGEWGLVESFKQGRQASSSVAGILGVSWVSTFAEGLALFALLSSFMAQSLALTHFLADAFKVKEGQHENLRLCALALAPPLLCALLYPQLFIQALNFAGGVCAVILFGVLPALMVWRGRYIKATPSAYQVTGGKPLLIGVMVFALFILFFQLSSMAGAPYLPKP